MDLIPKNDDIQKGISNITQQALCLKVVDNITYVQAGSMRIAHTDMEKKIKAFLDPLCDKANQAHKALTKARKDEIDKLKPGKNHLDKQILAWEEYQEELRLQEEVGLREIARRKAEEQQLQDAMEAEENGDKEEAEAILNEEPHVPTPVVAPSTPKIAGLGTVTYWKFRVIDASKVPPHLMIPATPNLVAIGDIVRQMKEKTNIEGIEAYPHTTKRGVRQ